MKQSILRIWCFCTVIFYISRLFYLGLSSSMAPPSRKELLIRLTVCSLCIMSIFYFSCFLFGFEGGTVVLIVPVPVLTFYFLYQVYRK